MKKILTAASMLTAFAIAGPAAAEALDTAKKYGCLACHAVEKKVVGPAWNDVATKYKGDGAAGDTLTASIRSGSKGKWGPIPMPPQAKPSDAEVKELVDFVISLAK